MLYAVLDIVSLWVQSLGGRVQRRRRRGGWFSLPVPELIALVHEGWPQRSSCWQPCSWGPPSRGGQLSLSDSGSVECGGSLQVYLLTARLVCSNLITVHQVSSFILCLLFHSASFSGCEELAAQFLSQEIDGQALLLLREDHLISTMNIKLGPALKICASINTLREWWSKHLRVTERSFSCF